ncbi:MAG: hypothetical protein DDG60_08650 [Anaerolineae bacterium]|nr:MAG: hypothetical protein DDG60_08650 [Anaerolineae bacterium]
MGDITDLLKKPLVVAIMGLILGLALGLFYGYMVDPVQWTDLPISSTRPDLQDDYLRMAIDSYAINRDEPLAVRRYQEVGPNAYNIMQQIKTTPGKLDPKTIAEFEQVLMKNGVYIPGGAAQPTQPSTGGSLGAVAAIFGGLLALGLIAAFAFWLFRRPRSSGVLTPAQQAREYARAVEKTDYAAAGQEPPIAQYVTSYVIGDDLFDDSFSIDAPSGEFLGECGVGISETIGVGDPKKVTAFEVWMFDKNDIQTVTKVLMTPHAFRDPNFRAKLEAKGELFELGLHRQVVLETQTLQMVATVADIQYGDGPLPPESYCDRLTLELAIWKK